MVREVGVDMGGEDEHVEPEEDEVDIIEDENKQKDTKKNEDITIPKAIGSGGKKRANTSNEGVGKAKRSKMCFKEKFLEMQEKQMEAAVESDRQNRDLLMKLEEQHEKAAAEEKQRDRECFMQLATLLAKK